MVLQDPVIQKSGQELSMTCQGVINLQACMWCTQRIKFCQQYLSSKDLWSIQPIIVTHILKDVPHVFGVNIFISWSQLAEY